MAYQPTSNFGWAMPRGGDKAEISVINQYFTAKADEIVYQNRLISAPAFDTTKAYTAGEMCVYENVLYKFTADKAAGNWDSTKVTATNLADEVTDAAQSGGTEVEANPVEAATADLHKLKVDTTVYGIPDPTVTKTATGNPIEFSDGADAPLVKCVTEITGSQDLHGYDKPWVGGAGKNKLIPKLSDASSSGIVLEVLSNGKYRVHGTNTASTRVSFELSNYSSDRCILPVGNYTISWVGSTKIQMEVSGTNYNGVTYTILTPLTLSRSISVVNANQPFNYITISVPAGETVDDTIGVQIEEGSTATPWTPYSNICPITAYDEGEIEVRGKNLFDYTQSQNISSFQSGATIIFSPSDARIVTCGGKVKNGETYTFSFPSGVKIATMFYYENDTLPLNQGSGSIVGTNISVENASGVYTFTATETNYVYFYFAPTQGQTTLPISTLSTAQMEEGSVATTYEPYTSTTHTTTYPSAIYRGSEDVVNGEVETKKIKLSKKWSEGLSTTVIGDYTRKTFVLPSNAVPNDPSAICNVAPRILNYTTDELHFYVATETVLVFLPNDTDGNTDIEIVYELATPTTSSVTPTNLPIKSLSPYTHIESSTGDMEVEYITEGYQPIVDLIDEAVDTKRAYSTTEHVVGKWIDGKDVYEKTYTFSSLPSVGDWTAFDEDCGIDTFVDYSLMYTRQNGQVDNSSDMLRVAYNPPNALGDLCYYPGGVGATHITVRYTKATVTTRSLSKGATDSLKADLSEEKKEIEELPETVEEPAEKTEEPVEEPTEKEENER